MPRVTIHHENHIAHVRLTRPDKMNAVDAEMIAAVIAAAEEVAASTARVCVLSGEGRAFCAGTDVSAFDSSSARDPISGLMARTHGSGTTNKFQEFALIWQRLPQPVIAALHGPVFGAGFQLALGADIRIAGPDAKLALMEARWGLVPDMGGMILLPKLVRSDVIRYMTYTAQPIEAAQAQTWGLVTELADDPLAAAFELAATIAQKSPAATRVAKELIALAETAPAEEVLLAESRAQTELIGGPDQREIIAATQEGRTPVFK